MAIGSEASIITNQKFYKYKKKKKKVLCCIRKKRFRKEVVVVGLNLKNLCSIIKYIHDNSAADLSNLFQIYV
ncbi:hypothetical protein CMV_006484 [Castanea mollissima]|uniref:Uncharacterized protein n=1 Tax=Castanea mollissima TaxID=60419 RepID=A0A8J4VR65_9ROSI|nr:hypothetical protein CMV_006484 [Castanea mollissima]